MRNTCRKHTIRTITSPKTKRTTKASVMMMVRRGIKERRTLRNVLTPRNRKRRRRVLSLSI
jgi:hypothetical protein